MKQQTSKRWLSVADNLRSKGYAVQYNWEIRTNEHTLDCVRIINKETAQHLDIIVQSWVHHGSDCGFQVYFADRSNRITTMFTTIKERTTV